MKALKSLYIFAGEPSGDNHGALLAHAIKKNHPQWLLHGVPGPSMRKEGVAGFLKMEQFSVMGITDVLRNLPSLIGLFKQVRDEIINLQPDAVVFIDYPVFNIRMAKALRKKGFKGKLIHYICPSVWAHGKERIQKMAESLDLLLTIFPFEPAYFKNTSLETTYVGNPVAEAINHYQHDPDWMQKLNIDPNRKIISLFPGSRKGAVSRNLPLQLEAAEHILKKDPHVQFALSCANPNLTNLITPMLEKKKLPVTLVPEKYRYELMRNSSAALATSGTVTLELALHKTPTVVNYALTPLNRFIAKYIYKLNLPHYCIVNIIGKKSIFPELITSGSQPHKLAEEILNLHSQTEQRKQCIEDCQKIANYLTNASASDNAVKSLEKLLC